MEFIHVSFFLTISGHRYPEVVKYTGYDTRRLYNLQVMIPRCCASCGYHIQEIATKKPFFYNKSAKTNRTYKKYFGGVTLGPRYFSFMENLMPLTNPATIAKSRFYSNGLDNKRTTPPGPTRDVLELFKFLANFCGVMDTGKL